MSVEDCNISYFLSFSIMLRIKVYLCQHKITYFFKHFTKVIFHVLEYCTLYIYVCVTLITDSLNNNTLSKLFCNCV